MLNYLIYLVRYFIASRPSTPLDVLEERRIRAERPGR